MTDLSHLDAWPEFKEGVRMTADKNQAELLKKIEKINSMDNHSVVIIRDWRGLYLADRVHDLSGCDYDKIESITEHQARDLNKSGVANFLTGLMAENQN